MKAAILGIFTPIGKSCDEALWNQNPRAWLPEMKKDHVTHCYFFFSPPTFLSLNNGTLLYAKSSGDTYCTFGSLRITNTFPLLSQFRYLTQKWISVFVVVTLIADWACSYSHCHMARTLLKGCFDESLPVAPRSEWKDLHQTPLLYTCPTRLRCPFW